MIHEVISMDTDGSLTSCFKFQVRELKDGLMISGRVSLVSLHNHFNISEFFRKAIDVPRPIVAVLVVTRL